MGNLLCLDQLGGASHHRAQGASASIQWYNSRSSLNHDYSRSTSVALGGGVGGMAYAGSQSVSHYPMGSSVTPLPELI